MKKIYGIAAIAALALTGCSSDNEPVIEQGSTPQTSANGVAGYMAVSIVNPSSTATRTDGYLVGSDKENKAETATFVFFKDDVATQVNPNVNLTPWAGKSDYPGTVENISSAVLLVDNASDKTTPTKVLAILNKPEGLEITTGQTLDYIKSNLVDYSVEAYTKEGTFVMTNSVYKEGTTVIDATPITEANFFPTAEAAKGKPAEIYVERIVAKVTTSSLADATNNGAEVTYQDGTTAKLYIQVKGIEIANIADGANLVKSIAGNDTYPFTNWNSTENHRSFWATMPSKEYGYKNQSWKVTSELSANEAQEFYINENTSAIKSSVLITAQLTTDEAGNTPAELIMYNNEYYKESDGVTAIANTLNGDSRNFRIKSYNADKKETTYSTFGVDDFEWATSFTKEEEKDKKGWFGYIQLSADGKAKADNFVKYEDGKWVKATIDEINAALKEEKFLAWKWTDGKCYYFVEINHRGELKGIVRNHIYQLTLSSVTGVGVPVFDPNREIVPEIPKKGDNLWNLAARLNVLQWAIATQNVNFDIDY